MGLMTRFARPTLAHAGFIVAVSIAVPARAADPDAHELFDRGVAAMEARRFDEACPTLERSYKLDARPGTLFALADCEGKRGRLATAVERYDQYIALIATLPPDKQRGHADRVKLARNEKAALLPDVPEVTITLAPNAPQRTLVTRDGVPVGPTALGVPMRVDLGEHVFTAQAPGGPPTEKRITAGRGERQTVQLEVTEPAPTAGPIQPPVPAAAPVSAGPVPPAQPAPDVDRGPSGRRVAGFVTVGVGIAGLAVGGVTGGLAIAKKSVVTSNCGIGGDASACNATGKAAADSVNTLGIASTVGLVVGGALALTGIVLLATEPKHSRPTASGRRWIRAEVRPAGTSGMTASIGGGW
jgi:hypothetical protein